jgi:uncharacterized protein (DUF302 family)
MTVNRRSSRRLALAILALAGTLSMARPTLASAADSPGGTEGSQRSTASVQITHVTETYPCDYEKFTHNLMNLLGRYHPGDAALGSTDVKAALDRIRSSQGEQGLMYFGSNDHGALFPLVGKPLRKAVRYYIGNPLIAIQMTRKNQDAALYAPLIVLVYEPGPGAVKVEYDLPSSSFGQFRDPDIDQVAASLDARLHTLIVKAAS